MACFPHTCHKYKPPPCARRSVPLSWVSGGAPLIKSKTSDGWLVPIASAQAGQLWTPGKEKVVLPKLARFLKRLPPRANRGQGAAMLPHRWRWEIREPDVPTGSSTRCCACASGVRGAERKCGGRVAEGARGASVRDLWSGGPAEPAEALW